MNIRFGDSALSLSIAHNQTDVRTVIPSDWRAVLAIFPEEIREAWEERAAIIEYEGREPRPTAERRAFECMLAQFDEALLILSAYLRVASSRGSKKFVA